MAETRTETVTATTADARSRPDARIPVNVRMRGSAITALDEIAVEYGWDRSRALRNILALGMRAWGRGERMTPPAR